MIRNKRKEVIFNFLNFNDRKFSSFSFPFSILIPVQYFFVISSPFFYFSYVSIDNIGRYIFVGRLHAILLK